jgi:hypothetical protein
MADWMKRISGVFNRGKPLAEALPEMIDPGDPRVVIRIFGDDWLCPFTARRVEAPDWNGSSLTVLHSPSIKNHLLNEPELQKLGSNAQMKSYEELVSICVFQRIQAGGNYKYTAPSGEWVCPYCMQKTEILLKNWDGSDVEMKFYLNPMLQHFAKCEDYQTDPVGGAKTFEDIREAGGDRAKLKRYLKSDPRFRLCDAGGAWLCPFAGRTVAKFNLKKEAWGEQLHERLLDYMLSPDCPGKYSQFEVERSLEDLQRAANTKHALL